MGANILGLSVGFLDNFTCIKRQRARACHSTQVAVGGRLHGISSLPCLQGLQDLLQVGSRSTPFPAKSSHKPESEVLIGFASPSSLHPKQGLAVWPRLGRNR